MSFLTLQQTQFQRILLVCAVFSFSQSCFAQNISAINSKYILSGKISSIDNTGVFSTISKRANWSFITLRSSDTIISCNEWLGQSKKINILYFRKGKLYVQLDVETDIETLLDENSKIRARPFVVKADQFYVKDFDSTQIGSLFSYVMMATHFYNPDIGFRREQVAEKMRSVKNGIVEMKNDKGTILYGMKNGGLAKVEFVPARDFDVPLRFELSQPVNSSSTTWEGELWLGKDKSGAKKTESRDKVTITKCSYNETEIRQFINRIHNLIPKNEKLITERTDPFIYRWNGDDFVRSESKAADRIAGEQKLVRELSTSTAQQKPKSGQLWYWLLLAATISLLIGVLIIRRVRTGKYIVAILALAVVDRQVIASYDEEDVGSYCGLYSVRAASNALGKPIPFDALLDTKYISSQSGSRADELILALSDHGLFSRVRPRILLSELADCRRPVLLHTRTPGARGYKHWILYLGRTPDGRASIFDPPHSQKPISFSELQSVWDGYGIEVSTEPLGTAWPTIPLEWFVVTLLIGFLIVMLRGKIRPIFLIPAISAVSAIAWHTLSPTGFINQKESHALGFVRLAYSKESIPEIDYDELTRIQNSGGIIVDTRMSSIYREQHIPGSVNVPVNSSFVEWQRILSELPRDQILVAYCLSESCGWSDTVANALKQFGFHDVCVYRGGFMDWQNRNPSKLP